MISTFWVLIAAVVLGAGALVFGVYALAWRVGRRFEVRRLRKQGRTVSRGAARAMVADGSHVLVVNKTSLPGALWMLKRDADKDWPLQTRLAQSGLIVEDTDPGFVSALTGEFLEQTWTCEEEVFDS